MDRPLRLAERAEIARSRPGIPGKSDPACPAKLSAPGKVSALGELSAPRKWSAQPKRRWPKAILCAVRAPSHQPPAPPLGNPQAHGKYPPAHETPPSVLSADLRAFSVHPLVDSTSPVVRAANPLVRPTNPLVRPANPRVSAKTRESASPTRGLAPRARGSVRPIRGLRPKPAGSQDGPTGSPKVQACWRRGPTGWQRGQQGWPNKPPSPLEKPAEFPQNPRVFRKSQPEKAAKPRPNLHKTSPVRQKQPHPRAKRCGLRRLVAAFPPEACRGPSPRPQPRAPPPGRDAFHLPAVHDCQTSASSCSHPSGFQEKPCPIKLLLLP